MANRRKARALGIEELDAKVTEEFLDVAHKAPKKKPSQAPLRPFWSMNAVTKKTALQTGATTLEQNPVLASLLLKRQNSTSLKTTNAKKEEPKTEETQPENPRK
mmetsp:Transcript_28277/g.37745  ORF Transcript_28277/g.37745 Transcript_28277/m.37745 type:complete len:104 (-) Transcript_28277:141-452(-)|eukprot:CAMPEP_0185580246 /NCGR_PEP_ID=MMETSP0434-20130131/15856_1 /TAXON_ID=626734 ORGANISM="Favella taraikaensis, Strain Fe Narragansett Bay" /NCGR_SAMPLE_ID=MMETSP0434 /ASSEMBLY_ACC=CAM_ASM_000379 /LENGTH=103 /DNA_ID=CAMNT_0028198459 /DNA_START=308 /DNA_END=619 /DNA_ORIENTATION=+